MPEITQKSLKKEQKLQSLRDILAQKTGIYPITQEKIDESKIEKMLVDEAKRINTSFDINPIKIESFQQNILQFQSLQLADNQSISHLLFFYGLETSSGNNQLTLVIKGVKLDDSAMANLTKKPRHVSPTEFSNINLLPSEHSDRINENKNSRKQFIDFFEMLYRHKKIVHGAYIRVHDFLEALQALENEGCDELKITFGFLKGMTAKDWNCFHMIFRGINSASADTLSQSIFSTFDGDTAFSAVKVGTPPFGS